MMTTNGTERLSVVIRPVVGRDLPGLLRLNRDGIRLGLPEVYVNGYTPLTGLLQGRWSPVRGERIRTYVASARRTPLAFVQARESTSRQRHRWDIVYLGAAHVGTTNSPERRHDLWARLLDYTTVSAGRRGVQRLFARIARDNEAAEAFRVAGYSRYSEETIFLLRGQEATDPAEPAVDVSSDEIVLRAQTAVDTWAIHRLYTLTAPKAVQYAEAQTSHHWELPQRRLMPTSSNTRERGFLVEQDQEIAIYCRVGQRGRRSWLEFVVEPGARALLGPTISAVLRWLDLGPDARVYCAVREYQQELGSALSDFGFAPVSTQEMLVRYTTVTSRALSVDTQRVRKRELVGIPAGILNRRRCTDPGRGPEEPVTTRTMP